LYSINSAGIALWNIENCALFIDHVSAHEINAQRSMLNTQTNLTIVQLQIPNSDLINWPTN